MSTAPTQAPLSITSSLQALASPPPAVRNSLPSSLFPSSRPSIQQASDELVALLLARRSRSGNKSSSGGDDARISTLVEMLTSAKAVFDPAVCLDGPLYVSSVIEGPAPLWERFGIQPGGGGFSSNSSNRRNLQGQQYKYSADDKRVVNYAEVFGKAFHVRAYGTYMYEQDEGYDTVGADANADPSDKLTSPLGGVLSFFGGGTQSKPSSSNLIQCPADFTVTVSKGLFVFGSLRLDIPISGTGYLRVLYADPNIRLFVSPKSTTDDRWEKAGLKVAQIRVDLVEEDEFENLLAE